MKTFSEYLLNAPNWVVRLYLFFVIKDKEEYRNKKSELLNKINEQIRRDKTEKYLSIHCGNYTDKEKAITRNAIQIGWEMRSQLK